MDTESQMARLDHMERHLSLLGDLLEEQARLQTSIRLPRRREDIIVKPAPIENLYSLGETGDESAPLSRATLPKGKATFNLKSGNWQ